MTAGTSESEDDGEPHGRSFMCSGWELRITDRCLVEDLEFEAGADFEVALRHPIVEAFAKKRLRSTGEGKTVGPEAGPNTLHHLGTQRHRGATWWDGENKVVWLCAYGWHESGADDDAFQLFDELIEAARIKPTAADVSLLRDDRAERLANMLPETAAILLGEARADPDSEKTITVGGLGLSILVRYIETLEEVFVAVFGGTGREINALRLSLFPEAELGEWTLEERLPTRTLNDADYEVCYSIWHGDV